MPRMANCASFYISEKVWRRLVLAGVDLGSTAAVFDGLAAIVREDGAAAERESDAIRYIAEANRLKLFDQWRLDNAAG